MTNETHKTCIDECVACAQECERCDTQCCAPVPPEYSVPRASAALTFLAKESLLS